MKLANKSTLIVGKNHTGKSTFVKEIILAPYVKKNKAYIIVACSNDSKTFRGANTLYFDARDGTFKSSITKKVFPSIEDAMKEYKKQIVVYFNTHSIVDLDYYQCFKELSKSLLNIRNCLLVFDDVRSVTSKRGNSALKAMLVDFRHKKQNCVFVYHSLNDIHVDLITHFDYLVLFRTNDSEDNLNKAVGRWKKYKMDVDKTSKVTNNQHYYNIYDISDN